MATISGVLMTRARLVALTVAAAVLLTGCGSAPASKAEVKSQTSTSASKSARPSATRSAPAANTEHGSVKNIANPDWTKWRTDGNDLTFDVTPGVINQAHLPKAQANQYADIYRHYVTAHYMKPGRLAGTYFLPDSERAELRQEASKEFVDWLDKGPLDSLDTVFRFIERRDPVDGKPKSFHHLPKKARTGIGNLIGCIFWGGFKPHSVVKVGAPRLYRDNNVRGRIWVNAALSLNKGKFDALDGTSVIFFRLAIDEIGGKPLIVSSWFENPNFKG